MRLSVLTLIPAIFPAVLFSQTQEAPPEPTFRSGVQLVLVPVIVRDSRGGSVGNLRRGSFRLTDEGASQQISHFVVERQSTIRDNPGNANASNQTPPPPALPQRFISYLFDDLHIAFTDLDYARKAFETHLTRQELGSSRASIASSSGLVATPFTADRETLLDATRRIVPAAATHPGLQCPEISYYMADLIVNRRDGPALGAALSQLNNCGPPVPRSVAISIIRTESARVLDLERDRTTATLKVLNRMLDQMSRLRGHRDIVVLSSGFHLTQERPEMERVLARAVELGVVINTVNAHGVHGGVVDADRAQVVPTFVTAAFRANSDALVTMADQTGGIHIENTNDLKAALERAAGQPEYVYVLGFTPSADEKPGTYRKLKVSLADSRDLSVQARRGYYVPAPTAPGDTGRASVRTAMFSMTDASALSVAVNASFPDTGQASQLQLTVRIDADGMPFRTVEGRKFNSLTIVYGLFDPNGAYVGEMTRKADLRFDEAALEKFRRQGIQLGASFNADPGTYLARVVVFESETGKTAALSRMISSHR